MLYTKIIFMKSYYPLLDILRFLAAFWVMNFHYFLGFSGELSWYRYGNLGVPLFFIISGFVISQSVANSSTKAFALGRFIRLAPLFWILCTITYLITLVVPGANPVLFPEYLISMTMLGDHFSSLLGYGRVVDAAYWSLAVELIFYTGIGLFVYLFKWKRIRWFTALWFAVSAIAFYFHRDDTFIAKTLLVRHVSYFLFGMTLMLIASSHYESWRLKVYDYAFLIGMGIYGTLISYRALPPYLTPNPHDANIVAVLQTVFFILTALLIYLSRFIHDRKWIDRAIIIGGLTYPLYLMHQTIGTTLITFLTTRYHLPWNPIAITFEVFIVGMAYLVYRKDKKMRAWLRHKFEVSKASDVAVL
jgi:peptidoglycan/LPS O-acetylase OafA/YrhL